jgi:hypothetical protein
MLAIQCWVDFSKLVSFDVQPLPIVKALLKQLYNSSSVVADLAYKSLMSIVSRKSSMDHLVKLMCSECSVTSNYPRTKVQLSKLLLECLRNTSDDNLPSNVRKCIDKLVSDPQLQVRGIGKQCMTEYERLSKLSSSSVLNTPSVTTVTPRKLSRLPSPNENRNTINLPAKINNDTLNQRLASLLPAMSSVSSVATQAALISLRTSTDLVRKDLVKLLVEKSISLNSEKLCYVLAKRPEFSEYKNLLGQKFSISQ